MLRFLHWLHRRLVLLLALPLLLLTLSGLLIESRHFAEVQVPMSWMFRQSPDLLPVTHFLPLPDGSTWIGTPRGLLHVDPVKPNQIHSESAFAGLEITALARLRDQPFPIVATQTALWSRSAEGPWEMRLRGRVHQLSLQDNGELLLILGGTQDLSETRAMRSCDGISWLPHPAAQQAARSMPALQQPTVGLHQFATELHNGSFLFGHGTSGRIWTLLLGSGLLLLLGIGAGMALGSSCHPADSRGSHDFQGAGTPPVTDQAPAASSKRSFTRS
jgi:hypothetical protein